MPLMISAATTRHLAIALVICSLTGCDGGFFLTARVVDSEGHAVKGVKVHASSKKSSRVFDSVSDANGCLSLGSLIAPGKFDFAVIVHASGFKPLKFAAPTVEANNFQLVLAQESQAFTSQVQKLDETRIRRDCRGI